MDIDDDECTALQQQKKRSLVLRVRGSTIYIWSWVPGLLVLSPVGE
jgi:hypothetical protein